MPRDQLALVSFSSDISELNPSLHEPVELSDIELEDEESIFTESDHDASTIDTEMCYPARSELVVPQFTNNDSVLKYVERLEECVKNLEQECLCQKMKTDEVEQKIAKLKDARGSSKDRYKMRSPAPELHSQKLLDFIKECLESKDPSLSKVIKYTDESVKKEFRIVDPQRLADEWGKQKGKTSLTMKKLSRSFTYLVKNKQQLKKISKWRYRIIKDKSKRPSTSYETSPISWISSSRETTSDTSYESDYYSPGSIEVITPRGESPYTLSRLSSPNPARVESPSSVNATVSSAASPIASIASKVMSTGCKSSPLLAITQQQSFSSMLMYASCLTTINSSATPSPPDMSTPPSPPDMSTPPPPPDNSTKSPSPSMEIEPSSTQISVQPHSSTLVAPFTPESPTTTSSEIGQETLSPASTVYQESYPASPEDPQNRSIVTALTQHLLDANINPIREEACETSISPDSYCINPSFVTSANSHMFDINCEETVAKSPYENSDMNVDQLPGVSSFLGLLRESNDPPITNTQIALPRGGNLNAGVYYGTARSLSMLEYLDMDSLTFTPSFSSFTTNPIDDLMNNSLELYDWTTR